ncbi:hypothetical protein AA23498_0272 [Acetobacter nitrogenifigens DSM 23921 = NBRC 105050]|nr:hypothetical protein AA23498_0272 [Acetobacter nitrogenifigens DSM 23921 = NBRC 105050]
MHLIPEFRRHQSVAFIEHDVAAGGEIDLVPSREVEKATRGSDNNACTLGNIVLCAFWRFGLFVGAAIDRERAQFGSRRQLTPHCSNLTRKFARRDDDKSSGGSLGQQNVHQRQKIAGGFSSSSRCDDLSIGAFKNHRYCARLNRRRGV